MADEGLNQRMDHRTLLKMFSLGNRLRVYARKNELLLLHIYLAGTTGSLLISGKGNGNLGRPAAAMHIFARLH